MVYGQFLEADVCETIHNFRFSPFVLYSYHLPQVVRFFRQTTIRMLRLVAAKSSEIAINGLSLRDNENLMDVWKQHNELFIKLVNLYNQNAIINQCTVFDIVEVSKQVTVKWGICRIKPDKIVTGNYSLVTSTEKIYRKSY